MKQWLKKHDPEIASYRDDGGMVPEGFVWDSYVAQTQLEAALDHIIKATRIVMTPDIVAMREAGLSPSPVEVPAPYWAAQLTARAMQTAPTGRRRHTPFAAAVCSASAVR